MIIVNKIGNEFRVLIGERRFIDWWTKLKEDSQTKHNSWIIEYSKTIDVSMNNGLCN